jgi:hypothetical protein
VILRLAAAAALAALVSAGQPTTDEGEVAHLLTGTFGFAPSDLADLARNKVIKRSLPASAPGEIAVVGAIRIHASRTVFMQRVRDIAQFKRGPEVVQIGTFHQPPTLADLAPLTVGPDDFDPRSCRVHDCDIRLPADAITRIQQAVAGDRQDAQARASAAFKRVLVEHVRAYLDGGAGRITEYDDGEAPIRPNDQFAAILASAPELGKLAPGIAAHLLDPTNKRLPGAEDVVYWSKEKFGFASFITVTHVCITCPSAALCVIASRDVYSSRYIDASLSVAIAADVPGVADAFDLVYANRSRANALKGAFASLRRSIAERRARSGLEETLKRLRVSLERR